jgi:hypothetical protein
MYKYIMMMMMLIIVVIIITIIIIIIIINMYLRSLRSSLNTLTLLIVQHSTDAQQRNMYCNRYAHVTIRKYLLTYLHTKMISTVLHLPWYIPINRINTNASPSIHRFAAKKRYNLRSSIFSCPICLFTFKLFILNVTNA